MLTAKPDTRTLERMATGTVNPNHRVDKAFRLYIAHYQAKSKLSDSENDELKRLIHDYNWTEYNKDSKAQKPTRRAASKKAQPKQADNHVTGDRLRPRMIVQLEGAWFQVARIYPANGQADSVRYLSVKGRSGKSLRVAVNPDQSYEIADSFPPARVRKPGDYD